MVGLGRIWGWVRVQNPRTSRQTLQKLFFALAGLGWLRARFRVGVGLAGCLGLVLCWLRLCLGLDLRLV